MIGLIELWLFALNLGCRSGMVYVEPTWRHEPPPPQEQELPHWAPALGYRARHRYRYYPDLMFITILKKGFTFTVLLRLIWYCIFWVGIRRA